jgi:hypothetical protein
MGTTFTDIFAAMEDSDKEGVESDELNHFFQIFRDLSNRALRVAKDHSSSLKTGIFTTFIMTPPAIDAEPVGHVKYIQSVSPLLSRQVNV